MNFSVTLRFWLVLSCFLAVILADRATGQGTAGEFDARAVGYGFLENQGQWPNEIKYRTSGSGFSLAFLADGVSFCSGTELESDEIEEEHHSEGEEEEDEIYEYVVWNLHFEGGNANPKFVAGPLIAARTHYLMGSDTSAWFHHLPEYRSLTYLNVWDGIDVRFKLTLAGGLKYEFLLAPGADPDQINVSFQGVDGLKILENGSLEIGHPREPVIEDAPYSFAEESGRVIPVRYRITGKNSYGFASDQEINPEEAWVIDPFVRAWSSFLNPSVPNTANYALDVSHDPQGRLVVAGRADAGLPTTPGVYQGVNGGSQDAFIAKFTPDGSSLEFVTFIGGNNRDEALSVAVNDSGRIFVSGLSESTNFPTTPGAFAPSTIFGGLKPWVAALNPDGSSLVFSTLLCPSCTGEARALSPVSGNEVIVAGNTTFGGPNSFVGTPGAYQTTTGPGVPLFVCRINASGTSMIWGSLLGDNGNYLVNDVAVNALEEPYIVGRATAANANFVFPSSPGAIQPQAATGGFIVRFNASGSGLIYATMYGTDGFLNAVDVDKTSNEAYAAGFSSTIPTTPGSLQPLANGQEDVTVMRLNAAGTSLIYSTYLGGTGFDIAYGIAVNGAGEAYVSGYTNSTNFPLTSCQFPPPPPNIEDVFLAHLNPLGDNFACGGSTIYGGYSLDYFNPRISMRDDGLRDTLYMCLTTHSFNFPTTPGSFQTVKPNGNGDCPAGMKLVPVCPESPFQLTVCQGDSLPLFAPNEAVSILWSTGDTTPSIFVSQAGLVWVSYQLQGCTMADSFNLSISSPGPGLGQDTLICDTGAIFLPISAMSGNSWLWSTGATGVSIVANQAGTYWVEIFDSLTGCQSRDSMVVQVVPPPLVDLGGPVSLCQGGSVTLYADSVGNYPGATYLWSTGSTAGQITTSAPGWTWAELSTPDGCQHRDSVFVVVHPLPTPDLGPDTTLCDSAVLVLDGGTGFASWLWSNGGQTQTSSFNLPGLIWLEVTDVNGCRNRDSIIFTRGSSPNPQLGDDTTFCAGGNVTISANGFGSGHSFQWNTGASSAGIGVNQSGVYAVTITELLSGCTGHDSVSVQVFPQPLPHLPADTLVCDEDSVWLDPGLFAGYDWSNSSTSQVISVQNTGNYSVTVTDTNGCTSSATTEVKLMQVPRFDLGPDLESCASESFLLRVPQLPGDLIQWSTGSSAPSITISEGGLYWVEVRNECGVVRDSLELTIAAEQHGPFVPNAFYPNSEFPENRLFHATGDQPEEFMFRLYDRWGALIYETQSISEGWDGSINGKPAPEGVYIYTMVLRACDGKRRSRKGTVVLLR